MEDLTLVVLVLGTFFPALFAAIYLKKGTNPVKKARKAAESSLYDNLTQYREVEKSTIADILKRKDSEIKSYKLRLKEFEPLDEEDQQEKGITWEEITALANSKFPKYSMMLPLVKKQIMEATKGMTMEEVLQYVKQFTPNQQSQGEAPLPDAAGNQWRPDYA